MSREPASENGIRQTFDEAQNRALIFVLGKGEAEPGRVFADHKSTKIT